MLILVVDDENSLRTLVAEILSSEGYEVIQASDGLEALEMARQYRPSLILSDIMMPHMSGLELITALRQHPSTASIPVILLSAAYILPPDQTNPKGVAAFLAKPFDIATLAALVEEVSSHHEAQSPVATEIVHYPPQTLPQEDLASNPDNPTQDAQTGR